MFEQAGEQVAETMNQSSMAGQPMDEPAGNASAGQQPPSNYNSLHYANQLNENELVNVTREYPFDYAMVMFGYLMPFVLVVTLVTNLLVVLVLYKRHMRTPTNIVLFTMAIVDLGTLLSPSPWYLYIYTFGNHKEFLYPPSACYAHYIMTDVVPVFFHTSSTWLALLLASQRYIYVCHPTLARTWCTVPRVKRAILIILVVALLHQLTRFFDNTFVSVRVQYNRTQHLACKNEIAQWVHSLDIALYYSTYFIFRIFFVFLFPCVALITLNTLLFRALKRAENKRTQLLKTKFKIVGAEPSQAERASNQNFSVTGYNLGREASSNAAPATCGPARRPILETHTPLELPGGAGDETGGSTKGHKGDEPHSTPSEATSRVSPPADTSAHLKCHSTSPNSLLNGGQRAAADGSPGVAAGLCRTRRLSGGRLATTDLDREHPDEADEPPSGAAQRRRQLACGSRARSRDDDDEEASPPGRSSRSSSNASNTGSNTNDESTCPECAAYKAARRRCRRCSDEGPANASCEHHRPGYHQHAQLQHQPLSQCSSILGGGTNTTTNEDDISSCVVTQNQSSSMFVPVDETATECTGAREADAEETDDAANEEELSFNGDDPEEDHQGALRGSKSSKRARLPMGASIESRLECGCLTAKALALRRVRLLSKTRQSRGDGSETPPGRRAVGHSYSMVECQAGEQEGSSALESARVRGAARHRCGPSCSNSDPCINGHEHQQRAGAACSHQSQGGAGPLAKANSGLRLSGENADQQQPKMRNSASLVLAAVSTGASGGPASSAPLKLAREISARGNTHSSPHDLFLNGQHANGSGQPATATTTTTLYSANTNSIGSLLQVQAVAGGGKQPTSLSSSNLASGQQRARDQLSAGAPAAAGGVSLSSASGVTSRHGRMKSPSFASCTTGRGSRATLLGGNSAALPLLVSNQQNNVQATIPVSTRSMDSNRTTLMLVVVVTVFLIVEVPVALVTILHVVLNTFDVFKDFEFSQWLNYIKLFTNFFIMISYSVNFTIYCSMSKKFRETFRDLFRSAERKRTKRIFSQSQVQQSQYTQINHQFAASSVLTGANNNNNNNNNNGHKHQRRHLDLQQLGTSQPNDGSAGGILSQPPTTKARPHERLNSSQQLPQSEYEL